MARRLTIQRAMGFADRGALKHRVQGNCRLRSVRATAPGLTQAARQQGQASIHLRVACPHAQRKDPTLNVASELCRETQECAGVALRPTLTS